MVQGGCYIEASGHHAYIQIVLFSFQLPGMAKYRAKLFNRLGETAFLGRMYVVPTVSQPGPFIKASRESCRAAYTSRSARLKRIMICGKNGSRHANGQR